MQLSDTARWVACHSALPSPTGLTPSSAIPTPAAWRANAESSSRHNCNANAWAIAVRTYLFDKAIRGLLSREPVEMVVNLAAPRIPVPTGSNCRRVVALGRDRPPRDR